MNKQELLSAVSTLADMPKSAVERVLDGLAVATHAELSRDGEVTLPGLGKLKSSYRPGREGRNPATGETMQIAGKNAPKFTASKALKDALN